MKKRIILGVPAFIILLFLTGVLRFQISEGASPETKSSGSQEAFADIPHKGTVTMVDLGADSCIPCKMMAPILKKLEKEYNGRADIVFIDVWKNPEQAERFGIRVIPTQIFFDRNGNEAGRHEGFLKEAAIVEKLKELGVE